MDPSLLQPSRQAESSDEKPPLRDHDAHTSTSVDHRASPEGTEHDQHSDYDSQDDDNPSTGTGPDGAKRPRLRLAHACDRCRKRKIRCDTHHPCGPCQATKNECTFHTPSRRPPKPKNPDTVRSSSTSGFKRPHSPVKDQTALEARLAALEAMLRDVPPNVHNAFLSRLDARLGSGTGVGIKEGQHEGVNVALEALGGGVTDFSSLGSGNIGIGNGWASNGNAVAGSSGGDFDLSNFTSLGQSNTAPDWQGLSRISGGWAGGRSLTKKREEEGVDAMAKRMEGMSFFYEDEIGQAKWQGGSIPLIYAVFPLTNIQELRQDSHYSNF